MKQKIIKQTLAWHKKTFPDILPDEQRTQLIEKWCNFHNAQTREEKFQTLVDLFISNIGMCRFPIHDVAKSYAQINAALKSIPDTTKDELLQAVKEKVEKSQ